MSTYIPTRPDAQLFQTMITDFFSDVPYVAKCLWRDELLAAKWCLDQDMKHVYLRPLLEWRVQLDHNWSLPVGNLGKGLKKQLAPELWAKLEHCYAGARIEDNWAALFATIELFRQLAIVVSKRVTNSLDGKRCGIYHDGTSPSEWNKAQIAKFTDFFTDPPSVEGYEVVVEV
jgi:aminoglycoside 6-adenylyltransferase